MKLSLNFQEDRPTPLLKAKIPISIFNRPFNSIFTTSTTATAPTTKNNTNTNGTRTLSDLSFSVSTNFPTGPSLRFTYSPCTGGATTPVSPFSLSLKSGLGLFGSPQNSPLIFSARFSLSKTSPGSIVPTFSLHFKPQVGHFSLQKRTHSSSSNPEPDLNSGSGSHTNGCSHLDLGSTSNPVFGNGFVPDGSLGWQEVKLEPYSDGTEKEGSKYVDGVYGNSSGIGSLPGRELVCGEREKGGFLGGVSVEARTVFPLTKRVAVNLRWGVNAPGGFGTRLPSLTVNKIVIQRVQEVKEVNENNSGTNVGDLELLKGMCFWMRRDLEVLEEENRDMRNSLENLRLGVSARNAPRESNDVGKKAALASGGSIGEFEHWRNKRNQVEGNGQRELKKPANGISDLESELERAIKAASS